MADPIRTAAERLLQQLELHTPLHLESAKSDLRAALAAQPPAPVAWCRSDDFDAAAAKRQSFSGWREQHNDCDMALYAAPPAPLEGPAASDGELVDLAGCVEAWAARLDEGTAEERLLRRVAAVLKQRQAPPHDGEVDALIKILSRIARMLDFMPDGPPNGPVIHRVIELLRQLAPASDEEREELILEIEQAAHEANMRGDVACHLWNRAATLLRQPSPAPAAVAVAVNERPWEREGWCDAEGRCWFGAPVAGAADAGWILRKPSERLSHQITSLPHWAIPIPIPQPPQGGEMES